MALTPHPPSGKAAEDARHRARGACKRAVERETGKEALEPEGGKEGGREER